MRWTTKQLNEHYAKFPNRNPESVRARVGSSDNIAEAMVTVKSKHNGQQEPLDSNRGKGTSEAGGRVSVVVLLFRSRALDPDNATRSCKATIDAIRNEEVIDNDTTREISLEVLQIKCKKKEIYRQNQARN